MEKHACCTPTVGVRSDVLDDVRSDVRSDVLDDVRSDVRSDVA